ncbi:MAG: right-handed parallel beta-helix repeat-containing protein, partial [Verrucomicrobiota bacterium]
LQSRERWVRFAPGTYRITETIDIPTGKISLHGSDGTATLLMEGEGPALRFTGHHRGTGDPNTVKPTVHELERMPVLRDLVIEGRNPKADGVELIETLQMRLEGLLVRKLRHGIRLFKRNRNLMINHCHIYHNTGIGIFLDRVNLHQINIGDNHISYNRLGGIRIEGSEVRNLQITGNDIEYNNIKCHRKLRAEPTAEIYIDTTAKGASVNEVTIASNTIQSTISPGGANIRILESPDTGRPPGLWSISGNIIGSQENNIHLTGCHGVTLSGNSIYSCGQRNLLVEQSDQINIGANNFRRHTPSMHTGVRLVDSRDCVISSCILKDKFPEGQPTGASLLELKNCERVNITGSQFLDGVPYGIDVDHSRWINIAGCTVADTRPERKAKGSIRFRGEGERNLLTGNLLDVEAQGV